MALELPALREENEAYKRKSQVDDDIIAKQSQIIDLHLKTIDAQSKSISAAEKALELEKQAGLKDREALAVAEKRITELDNKLKRANKRNLILTVATAVLGAILIL